MWDLAIIHDLMILLILVKLIMAHGSASSRNINLWCSRWKHNDWTDIVSFIWGGSVRDIQISFFTISPIFVIKCEIGRRIWNLSGDNGGSIKFSIISNYSRNNFSSKQLEDCRLLLRWRCKWFLSNQKVHFSWWRCRMKLRLIEYRIMRTISCVMRTIGPNWHWSLICDTNASATGNSLTSSMVRAFGAYLISSLNFFSFLLVAVGLMSLNRFWLCSFGARVTFYDADCGSSSSVFYFQF